MNTETLGNLVTALQDAQTNPNMVATFSFESWGYPRDQDERDDQIRQSFEEPEEEDGYVDYEAIDYHWINECIDNVITTIPHNCGAPSCALGHYALRSDLQDFVTLDHMGSLMMLHEAQGKRAAMGVGDQRIAKHFGINVDQAIDLFGSKGCGGAKTPGEAADYIANWIDQTTIRNRFGQEADHEEE